MCALKSLMSQVLSNTSVKVFFGSKRGGGALPYPIFFFEGATDTPAPLLLRLCLSQTEVKYMNVMNPFSRDKEFEI